MALRALLFSKNPETADSLATVLGDTGIRAEICADIFGAIEKGTKQAFPCVIVDWSDQPEAGFLLKRTRESALNRTTIAIAIVEGELAPAELRESRIDFLLYRPIATDEARSVLAKVRQRLQWQSGAPVPDLRSSLEQVENASPADDAEDPDLVSIADDLPEPPPESRDVAATEGMFAGEPIAGEWLPKRQRHFIGFRAVCAVVLVLTAAFCFWRSREAFRYLAQTREGTFHVLQESVAALFYVSRSGTPSVGSAMSDGQQDAYFARTPARDVNGKQPAVGVVAAEITLPDTPGRLPRAVDFPLPSPTLERAEAPPARSGHTGIPDSLKNAAPISPPVVVTVNPAQIVPVSAPPPQIPQFGEPVQLNEESARALLVHSVAPVYPPEALAQKLHGPVVLQAVIGRDGSVQDLKLVRGYFVLGRAAIAAVKQWRFRPYNLNGRPAQTQTVITFNFSYPPA